jgi:thioester reductase-like protein
VTTVPGDVAKPMFGLATQAYVELAARVDAVIHCAAITDFNRTDGSLEATNIAGTEHMAAFAAAADAVLYHVSTAFVDTTVDGD